jgi:hypothetical protein
VSYIQSKPKHNLSSFMYPSLPKVVYPEEKS